MSLQVRYSLRAKSEEIELLEYVVLKFGMEKAKEVYMRIEKALHLISEKPEMFPASKSKKGLRKYVFSKQTSIYYRVRESYVEIISFRPNRKDPQQFKV